MENSEEDTQETATVTGTTTSNNTTEPQLDLAIPPITSTMDAIGVPEQNFLDDSVVLIQPHIDMVDLTTPPRPSTSSSTSGAGAPVGGLLKPKMEPSSSTKDTSSCTASTSTTQTTDNPSSSSSVVVAAAETASGLTGASSSGSDGGGGENTTTSTNLLECPICLQTCIHPARLPCGHIFCFLCVKGVAYKNRRCAMCRREIPPEFLDHPQLVNGIEDICTTKATDDGYQWFYEGRNGWWQYDDRTSQDLEEAFKKGERSCTILVAGYVYIVDFDAMIQQRQNEPARCRRVKRDLATIPKKGVAGLRIEGNTVTTDSNFAQQVYRQNRYHNDDLDIHETAMMGAHAMDSTNPQGPLRLSYGLGGYVIELGNPSEFVSTAAATDAALRIASDIIGSTLAHADELTRSSTSNNTAITSSSYQQSTDSALNPATGELNLNDLALISQQQQQQHQQQQHQLNATTALAGGVGTTNAISAIQQQPTTSSASLLTGSGHNVSLTRERGSRELLGAAEDLLGATQRVIATADQPTIELFEQTLNDFHALTLRNIVDSSDDDDGLHHQQQMQPTMSHPAPSSSSAGQRSNQQHDNLP